MRLILLLLTASFFYVITVFSGEKEDVKTHVEVPEVYVHEEANKAFLITDNGLLYFKGNLFSGYLESHYNGVNVKSIKGFYLGRSEGDYIGYYINGKRSFSRKYSEGEKQGVHKGWYPNGQLKFYYIFENGLSVGNHKEWYPDGSLYRDFNYLEGKQMSSQKEWYRSGKLKANFVVREDGRKYGLTGVKRCNNINAETQNLAPAQKRN